MAIPTPAVDPASTDERPGPSSAVAVRLERVEKRYGDVVAVDGVDLDVHDGEFFSMLGPSGSGKTTTLRMIAGFELPTAGRVLLHGADVTASPPFDRDVNTVFQDYALFPHMTVGEQRRLRAGRPQGRRRPSASARVAEALRHGPPRGLRGAQARPAVGRPAPARRAGPGAGQPAAGAAARRAARRARPEAARGDADRAQGDPAAGRHHLHLRDPRPGGGAHDERPAGRLQPRPDRAARARRPRSTSDPATPLRGRLRRARRTCYAARSPRRSSGDGGTFTIRPEKIRLADPETAVGADERSALGRIREVVYLGPDTRYIVDPGRRARSSS